MREKYWNFYLKIAYQFHYYKRFQIFFTKVNHGITIFCSLTALSSVAAWGIWDSYPIVWSALICASQLIQALFPKLPYNDLLCSTKFMICSLDTLLMKIGHGWHEIDLRHYTEEQIFELLKDYEAQYSELTSQFFAGTFLPEINHCAKMAEKECEAYFTTIFHS